MQTHLHLQYQRAHATQVSATDVRKSTEMSLVGHSFHEKIGSKWGQESTGAIPAYFTIR